MTRVRVIAGPYDVVRELEDGQAVRVMPTGGPDAEAE